MLGHERCEKKGDGRWWREARCEIDGASCLARRRHMMWGAPCMLIGRRTTLEGLRGRRHREGLWRPASCRPAVPLEVEIGASPGGSASRSCTLVWCMNRRCYSGRASTRSGSERPYWRAACSGIMSLGARMGRISAGAGGWTAARDSRMVSCLLAACDGAAYPTLPLPSCPLSRAGDEPLRTPPAAHGGGKREQAGGSLLSRPAVQVQHLTERGVSDSAATASGCRRRV